MQLLFLVLRLVGAIAIMFSVFKALEVGRAQYPWQGRIAMLLFGFLAMMTAVEALSQPPGRPFGSCLIFFVGVLSLAKSFAPLASTLVFPKCMWHASDIWQSERPPPRRRHQRPTVVG